MLCIKLALAVSILTAGCGFVSSDPTPTDPCSGSTLITIPSGLHFADSIYIDGVQTTIGHPKKLTIPTGASILAIQLDKEIGHIRAAASQTHNAVTRWVCTDSKPVDTAWSSIGFNDASWPFELSLPLASPFDDGWFNDAIQNVQRGGENTDTEDEKDFYCRGYLICSTAALPALSTVDLASAATSTTSATTVDLRTTAPV